MTLTMTTETSSAQKAWAKAIARPPKEFAPTQLKVISGAIPEGLRGSLYRNGPARLERGTESVGHWFDGDGAILGVHLTDAGATGVYRYVQTEGYQVEEEKGKLIFGGYGTMPPGGVWSRLTKPTKNVGNTSVLALPDKLLALWEGGKPHALDLQTLETFGIDNLEGLGSNATYSAHPKRDRLTGEIYNFGVSFGKNSILHVYRSSFSGKIQQKADIPIQGCHLIHDFLLAGQYLVFFISPVEMQVLPVLTKLKTFSDSLVWQPEKGTEILVIDRETLTLVSREKAEAWYQWHFGNGYVDAEGSIVLDLVRYEDFQTNQYLKDVPTGRTNTPAKGRLWQIRLNPASGKIREMYPVVDRACEFPVVNPQQVGQHSRYTYFALHRKGVDIGQELLSAIARFDYQTNTLTEADLGENCYPSEPIYAPDAKDPDRGWILIVVFDGNRECSEVWVFDASCLDAPPVCKLALPSVIPFGFHGTWKAA